MATLQVCANLSMFFVEPLLVYNTATGGTGRLERHIGQHKSLTAKTQSLPRKVPQMSKKIIARCAALAVVMDIRPLSFTDNKLGLTSLADALFRPGRATPVSDPIDPKTLLHCDKTVRSALQELLDDTRGEYNGLLPELIKTGGAVYTDGVTLSVQDKQFYDLTLLYIEYSTRTAFETSAVFHNALVMARVAGSSTSARVAPANEKWTGCLVHQLNTAMKCCISEVANQDDLKEKFSDIQAVKKIVRIFKQSNWNSLLPDGKRLIQEVETRFGPTFLVVKRFLQASSFVESIIQAKNSDTAVDAFASLSKAHLPSGDSCYPALEAVIDALQDVVEPQPEWEASLTPTIHLALGKFQICLDKLQTVVDSGSVWRGKDNGFIPAPRHSRLLCKAMIGWL